MKIYCLGSRKVAYRVFTSTSQCDTNLIKYIEYNSYCGFYRLKLQLFLQADSLELTHGELIRRYNSIVFYQSNILKIIQLLKIREEVWIAKVGIDKVYLRNNHINPIHTNSKIAMIIADE